jgi:ribulose-phosphate 3-epimerase
MAVVCPTVTAETPEAFKQQIEQVKGYASRIHLDFADGVFAPSKLISIKDAWWPESMTVDLHVMYKEPFQYIEEIIEKQPHLVVLHAESDGNFFEIANVLHSVGIKVGLALLQKTDVDEVKSVLHQIDHLLIFSGNLGFFGGKADPSMLHKVSHAKHINPDIEIGWDGGINDDSIIALIEEGVDVLNVGGYIQNAEDPQAAYATLNLIAENAL